MIICRGLTSVCAVGATVLETFAVTDQSVVCIHFLRLVPCCSYMAVPITHESLLQCKMINSERHHVSAGLSFECIFQFATSRIGIRRSIHSTLLTRQKSTQAPDVAALEL